MRHRIEALAKRLATLEAFREIEKAPIVMELHSGSMTILPADLTRLFREIDGKTRGIPCLQLHHLRGDMRDAL